jgi:hypothetical protein
MGEDPKRATSTLTLRDKSIGKLLRFRSEKTVHSLQIDPSLVCPAEAPRDAVDFD